MLSPITFLIQIFGADNKPVLSEDDADMLTWTTTLTVKQRVDFVITATPTAYTVNNVIGTSPAVLYIYNPNTTTLVVAGNQIVALNIPAGKGMLLPQFDTTGQLTLSTAGGGVAKVLVLD